MRRRTILKAAFAGIGLSSSPAFAQTDPLSEIFAQLQEDPTLVENAWTGSRRQNDPDRATGTGARSTRAISARSREMIVMFEVSSRKIYEAKYTRPIWPAGKSGVTIGIGYDLRFASEEYLNRDWAHLLSTDMIATLIPVLQLGGKEAKEALPTLQGVVVPWHAAEEQFGAFLPYPTAVVESVFKNTHKLSDDSLGALVSLVYNRGADMPEGSTRRREMREIRALMERERFSEIPAKFREMKRLWPGPKERGLILRREAEARLFELGLN